MDLELRGKVAMVTGGARGIGKAICLTFAGEGANVVACDVNGEGAQKTARECEALGVKALGVACDVIRYEAVEATVRLALERLGRIDILVNNAGRWNYVDFWESTRKEWDWPIDTVLYGTLNCCRAVVNHMKERGSGRIINIAAEAGRLGVTRVATYCAAKAGVIGLTKALTVELGPFGIAVNVLCPGPIVTEGTVESHRHRKEEYAKLSPEIREERQKFRASMYPLAAAQEGKPEDVAYLVAFLASERTASIISGQTISVSGGWTRF